MFSAPALRGLQGCEQQRESLQSLLEQGPRCARGRATTRECCQQTPLDLDRAKSFVFLHKFDAILNALICKLMNPNDFCHVLPSCLCCIPGRSEERRVGKE